MKYDDADTRIIAATASLENSDGCLTKRGHSII